MQVWVLFTQVSVIPFTKSVVKNLKRGAKIVLNPFSGFRGGGGELKAYPVDLTISANDRGSLIRDLSNVILNLKIPLMGMSSRVDKTTNHAHINLTIEIDSLALLNKVISQLRQTVGVIRVERG